MKLKTRVKLQHFFDGQILSAAYAVEVKVRRQWTAIGADGDITKYPTREAAQAAADLLTGKEV